MRTPQQGSWALAVAAALGLVTMACSSSSTAGAPPPAQPAAAVRAADNWTTYHYDQRRDGYDPNVATATSSLSVAWQTQLDGSVYAEPLVVSSTVIVATENDTVYGLGLDGSVHWQQHLGDPVPLSELPCGDIDPNGITGTPMYDPTTGDLYLSAILDHPIRHQVYALDPSDGHVVWHKSLDVSGMDPAVEQQRGAMAISQGRVWVTFGALAGDCGNYHGYAIGANVDGTGVLSVYRTPSTRGAGIWAPTGPSVDASGHLFVAPANGAAFAPPYDDSDSVVKLDGNQKVSLWAPKDWAKENANDLGQGPAAPLLFSALGQHWAFSIGKAGLVYLLHPGSLGGIGGQVAQSGGCEAFGGMAFHDGMAYVPCNEGLSAYVVRPGPTLVRVWRTTATGYGNDPVVGGGAVWALSAGNLLEIDPATGSTVASIAVGDNAHFATPTLHQNLVIVGTHAGVTAVRTS